LKLRELIPMIAVAALVLAAALVPIARRLALDLELLAKPANDRWHEAPVPLLGGVVVVGTFVLVGGLFGTPVWLLIGALALCAVGLVDDIMSLEPRTKLLCQLPLAILAAVWVKVPIFLPWGLQQLAFVFWILTAINSFNLIDGLDGLAAGVGIIATIAVAAIATAHHNPAVALTALALCGALSGFLLYNLSPASIYLGDAGSLAIGFVLGVLCLDAVRYAGESKLAILATPALLMAVPVIDTSIVTFTRLATGRAISNRGLDHCHHRLHNLGLSQRRVAFVLWALGAAGAAWAVLISLAWKPMIVLVLPLCALTFATVGLFLANLSFEHEPPGRVYGAVPGLGRLMLKLTYQRRAVEFALDFLVISAAYCGAILIHHNFKVLWPSVRHFSRALPAICLASYIAFLVTGTYRHMWRYASVEAALRFEVAAGLAGVLAAGVVAVVGPPIPASMLVVFAILLANLLVGTRMSFRILRSVLNYFAAPVRRVLVVGAGSIGDSAARELVRDGLERLSLVGFLDDDKFKHSMLVRGRRVLGAVHDIARVYRQTGFTEILIAQEETPEPDLKALQSFALDHGVVIHRYQSRIDSLTRTPPENGQVLDAVAPRFA
jgi:UDP-GlcNAc:undecaprenyl-phosphate/decaprenyl-phosphate GlcNAc-1-phosphate transferase